MEQQSISFSAVNILLSILGNCLILVALRKESSLHPPSKLLYRCLATTDPLVGLVNHPFYTTYVVGVEIQRDCKRRTYIILAIVWVACPVGGLLFHLKYRVGLSYSFMATLSCLAISITSYAKIFRALSHHQAQIQDHAQEQPSKPNTLTIVRYRKALYSALWVQLALVVCYVPLLTVEFVISLSKERFPNFIIIRGMAIVLVFFNSTLNPFLYCWKIREVRRAVKQTIKQATCYT